MSDRWDRLADLADFRVRNIRDRARAVSARSEGSTE